MEGPYPATTACFLYPGGSRSSKQALGPLRKRFGKLFICEAYILCTAAHPTDVGSSQMWYNLTSLFDSVTQNLSLAAFHDDQLLLGGGPGEDDFCVVAQNVIHLLLRKVLQIRPMDHTGLGIPTPHREVLSAFLTVRPRAVYRRGLCKGQGSYLGLT